MENLFMVNDSKIIDLLESGMRAEGLRQQAIANNIANINTEGFRRSDVNFQEILNKAIEKQDTLDPNKLEVEFVQPENTPVNEFNNDVSLDNEAGEMIKNTLLHRTYMLVLKKKYQQLDAAMRFQ
jgi:flagellar basal-body rod protein FlgB